MTVAAILPETAVLDDQKALFMSSIWTHWSVFFTSFFILISPSLEDKFIFGEINDQTGFTNTYMLDETHAVELLNAESMSLVKEKRTTEGRDKGSWKHAFRGRPVLNSVHLEEEEGTLNQWRGHKMIAKTHLTGTNLLVHLFVKLQLICSVLFQLWIFFFIDFCSCQTI